MSSNRPVIRRIILAVFAGLGLCPRAQASLFHGETLDSIANGISWVVLVIGPMYGLAFGLAIVAFLEYRDSTFKADYEVATVLSLPVLAVVPLMRSDAERKSEFRKHLFLNLGLGSAVAVCLAVLAYTFVR